MDEATRAKIFLPFFTTKPKGRGTGLGLATVWQIVERWGGRIECSSTPGRGTTFEVFVPRTDLAPADRRIAANAVPAPRGSEVVLVADDVDEIRSLMARTLHRLGYTVLEARHGREALDVLAGWVGPVHLLVSDLLMPVMSGRELAERVAAVRPEAKALFVSGYSEDAALPAAVREGRTGLLCKPFGPDEFARKVREVLDTPS